MIVCDRDEVALSPAPPPGQLLRVAWKVGRWAYGRTFRLSPIFWAAIALLGLAGGGLAVVSSQPRVVQQAAVAGGALATTVALAALATWLWTARRSRHMLIFLTPFDETSADATRVAPLQTRALAKMIRDDPLLREAVEVRALRGPLRRREAARLMVRSKAYVVVGGDVTTVAQLAKWSPWLMLRWTLTEGYLGLRLIHFGLPGLSRPTLAQLLEDPAVPIAVFAERDFELAHADGLRAALLLLCATERPDARSSARLAAAARLRDAMPLRIRTLLVMAENGIGGPLPEPAAMPALAARLAQAGEREADDPYLWAEVNTLLTLAERAGYSKPSTRLPYARRVAEAWPSNAATQWGLGICLLAVGEVLWDEERDLDGCSAHAHEAIGPLERALKLRRGVVPRREIRAALRIAQARAHGASPDET